jgi:translation elongation factor EF-G
VHSSVICSLRYKTSRKSATVSSAAVDTSEETWSQDIPPEIETNIASGFQIATFQGPLCAEPMEGLAYFMESIEVDVGQFGDENSEHSCWLH